VFIGALLWWKGFKYLLKAMKTLQDRKKNAELIVSGVGNDASAIIDFAKQLKLKNTKFLGLVPKEDLVRLYNSGHAFI
jgi:glycosyltransferase involved in cell wall biosynthesis